MKHDNNDLKDTQKRNYCGDAADSGKLCEDFEKKDKFEHDFDNELAKDDAANETATYSHDQKFYSKLTSFHDLRFSHFQMAPS